MTTMTTTKQLGLAASLVLASSFAMADNTHSLDAFSTTHANGDVTFAETFDTGVAGYFTDTLNFTVPNTSPLWDFSALITAPVTSIEFTDISLNGLNGTVATNGVFSIAEYGEIAVSGYGLLAPGAYSLLLSGIATDSSAEYDVVAVLSPVPEPSAIALMLGGLGLVGFMAARRRKNA